MLHGMEIDNDFIKIRNNKKKLKASLRSKKFIDNNTFNWITGRIRFLKIKKTYETIDKDPVSLQWVVDYLKKKEKLCNKLKIIINQPCQKVINSAEKELVFSLIASIGAIKNMYDLFTGTESKKNIEKILPTTRYETPYKKLKTIFPWLIKDNNGNNLFLWGLNNLSLKTIDYIVRYYPDLVFSKNNHHETALHVATKERNIGLVYILTKDSRIYKIDVDAQENKFGKTALHIACFDLNVKIVHRLLQCGAQIKFDYHEQTVLDVFFDRPLTKESIEIIQMILKKYPNTKAENSKNIFAQFILTHIKSAPKDMSTEKLLYDIKNLLEQKRKEQQLEAKIKKIKKECKPLEQKIKKQKLKEEEEEQKKQKNTTKKVITDGNTKPACPLRSPNKKPNEWFKAIAGGLKKCEKYIELHSIDKSDSIFNEQNSNQETPLCVAVKKNKLEVFKLLLKYGDNSEQKLHMHFLSKPHINLITPSGTLTTHSGCKWVSILEYIILSKRLNENQKYSFSKSLFNFNNDFLKENNNNNISLISSVSQEYNGLVKLLLEHGAEVNGKNKNGQVPIHYININCSDFKMIDLLMEYGADINIKMKNEKSLLFNVVEEICNLDKKTTDDINSNVLCIMSALILHGATCKKGKIYFNGTEVDFTSSDQVKKMKNTLRLAGDKIYGISSYSNQQYDLCTDFRYVFLTILLDTKDHVKMNEFLKDNKDIINTLDIITKVTEVKNCYPLDFAISKAFIAIENDENNEDEMRMIETLLTNGITKSNIFPDEDFIENIASELKKGTSELKLYKNEKKWIISVN